MSLPAYRIPPNLEGKADPSVVRAIRHIDKIVNEHEQAFAALGTQSTVASSKASVVNETINETTSTIAGVSSFNSATGSVSYFPALGVVNPQTGLTTYTTQTSDNGLIVLLNDSSPIAVTLNSTVSNPYFTTISNQGSGTATLTPSTGQVNGLASITVSGGSFATVYFDGNNWWAENPGSSVGGLPVNNPTFTGAITGPHYDSNGATPTIVVGPAAGVGGSASFVLATSTDAAGVVGISTGTGTTTGVLATVTFATPYPTNAIVLMNYGVQGTTITSSGFSPTSFQVVLSGTPLPASSGLGVFAIPYIVSGH